MAHLSPVQRHFATAFALASLIAPVRTLAAEPSLANPHAAESSATETHGEGLHAEEPHGAGALIFEQFVGEKIYIQDQGELYAIVEAAFEKSNHEHEFELAAELSFGVTERMQLVAELPFVFIDPEEGSKHEGLGDITLGIQYNFKQEPDFAFGVRSGFVIPSGNENKDLGDGHFVWEPNLLGALRVGQGEIYAAVGGEIRTGNSDPDAFTYTISGAYPWRRLTGVLDLGGSVSRDEHDLYLAPGAFFVVSDLLQIGVGVPIGLTRDSDDFQIVTLFVFEFF